MPVAARGDRRIAWDSVGQGAAVVLVPGTGAGARQFGTLPRRFARAGFRCLTMSPVGIAPSSAHEGAFSFEVAARDLLAVADAAGVEQWVPVGTSLGGKVSLLAAALAPERTLGLVMLASAAVTSARGRWVYRFFEELAGVLDADAFPRAVAPFLFGRTFHERRSDLVEDIVRGMRPDEGARALMLAQARALQEFDARRVAQALDVAALCVGGGEDTLTDARDVEATAALLPRGEYLEIEDAGHSLLLESPRAFEAVAGFLRRT